MTNSKQTKRALLSSVMALLLCFTMLLGTTFAWFTDNASTSVNTIQSGTLDVALEMKENGVWVTAEGKTLSFTSNYWEPGCTYSLPELRIKNNGNLAIKYKVAITGIKGDEELNDVIDWSISGVVMEHEYTLKAGFTHEFTISGHMQETAGNDYQNKKIESIAITVYATQATFEVDGTGENDYDEDADYDDGTADDPVVDTKIKTLEALKAAITNGDATIDLGANIELDGLLTFGTVTLNGNGYTLSNAPVRVGSGSTVNNVVFDNPVNAYNTSSNLYCGGSLTVDGCTFKNTQWDSIQVVPTAGDVVTINNCKFTANSSGAKRFIHVEAAKNSNTAVTINITNNSFGAWSSSNDDIVGLYYVQLSGINFGGNNTFVSDADLVAEKIWVCGPSAALTISGEDAYIKLTSKVVANATELAAAIQAGGKVYLTEDITVSDIISISKDVTIEGNGKTITAATGKDRVFNVKNVSDNISIKLSGLTIENNNNIAYDRGISFHDNSGKIRLEMDNCTVKTQHYAVNVGTGNSDIEIVVKDSNLTGYAAAQTWSAGSKLTFENCTLTGVNKWDGSGNDFSTVNVNEGATGSVVTLDNCTIKNTTSGTAKQTFFGIAANATVKATGCTYDNNGTTVTASEVSANANGDYCYIATATYTLTIN